MALSTRLLVFVGLISYPLYLWHWPLMAFARILSPEEPSRVTKGILIVASFVLAWLTYRFVENPIRTSRNRTVVASLVIVCAAVGIAGLVVRMQEGVPLRAINRSHGNGPILVAETRRQSEAIRAAEQWEKCDARMMDAVAAELCTVYGDAHATPIVVWGDSHAGAWASVFYKIAQEQNLRVYLFWAGGCPPMLEVRRTDSVARARGLCAQFGTSESVLTAIRAVHPKQIFVIGYWGLYTHSSNIEVSGMPATLSRAQREQALQARLVRTLSAAAEIAPVTVFRAMPTLVNDAQRALPRGFPLEPTLKAHKAYEAGLDRAIDTATAKNSNISVFDPSTITCQQRCAAVLHNTLLYRDTNHVSATGSLVFKDIILQDHFTVLRRAHRDTARTHLN
jgi:hypothetical protein